ncbi:MAG TPA: hypothetical protein VGF69_26330 [Thermoanaerobaculia bacterium]|jgi:hypothetical protein
MDHKDVSLELSVETIAVLCTADAENPRPEEQSLDLEGRNRGTMLSPRFCCP